MADYRSSTSFKLGCTDAEASLLLELDGYPENGVLGTTPSRALLELFPPVHTDFWSGYRAFLAERGLCHDPCFANSLFFENEAWYFGSFDVDLDFTARVLARVCKSALPIRYTWAYTCNKLRINEFGGGVAVVSTSQIAEWTTIEALSTPGDKETRWIITPI